MQWCENKTVVVSLKINGWVGGRDRAGSIEKLQRRKETVHERSIKK